MSIWTKMCLHIPNLTAWHGFHTYSVYFSTCFFQVRLAKALVETSFADKVFYANSGTEANEAALKFARKWARINGRVYLLGRAARVLFNALSMRISHDMCMPELLMLATSLSPILLYLFWTLHALVRVCCVPLEKSQPNSVPTDTFNDTEWQMKATLSSQYSNLVGHFVCSWNWSIWWHKNSPKWAGLLHKWLSWTNYGGSCSHV